MNIALGAFILTLLFLPSITFRFAINRYDQLKELLGSFSVTDSIWVFSIIPILIHVIELSVIYLFGYQVKFDLLLNILYSNKDFPIDNYYFQIDVLCFLGYSTVSNILGYLMGVLFCWLEVKYGFLSTLLGLTNYWDKVFSGKIIERSGEEKNIGDIDLVFVDVLATTKEATVLYSGILLDYYYKSKSSDLEFLVLQYARRRDLRKQTLSDIEMLPSGKISTYSEETGNSIKIPGEYFILPMNGVLNINVSFLSIENFDGSITELAE